MLVYSSGSPVTVRFCLCGTRAVAVFHEYPRLLQEPAKWGYHGARSCVFYRWDMVVLDVLVSAGALHNGQLVGCVMINLRWYLPRNA